MTIAPADTMFDEIVEFLSSYPSPEQILAYQVSESLDARLHELLDKNSQRVLSSEEQTELGIFLQLAHIITLFKAKALEKLGEQ